MQRTSNASGLGASVRDPSGLATPTIVLLSMWTAAAVFFGVHRVFFGHLGIGFLAASGLFGILALLYGIPLLVTALVLGNLSIARSLSRRFPRAVAFSTLTIVSVPLTLWLSGWFTGPTDHPVPHDHPIFHRDGTITFDHSWEIHRGLADWACAIMILAAQVYLLRGARTSGSAMSGAEVTTGMEHRAVG